jgi:hypothetical protein
MADVISKNYEVVTTFGIYTFTVTSDENGYTSVGNIRRNGSVWTSDYPAEVHAAIQDAILEVESLNGSNPQNYLIADNFLSEIAELGAQAQFAARTNLGFSNISIGDLSDVELGGNLEENKILKVVNGVFTQADLPAGVGGGFTQEEIEDFVGAMLTDGGGITWTYDDNNSQISGAVTISHLSVGGLSDVSLNNPVDGHVLRHNGAGQFVNVQLSYNDLANLPTLGTASSKNAGTGADEVLLLTQAGILPALDGSNLTSLPAITIGSLSDVDPNGVVNGQVLVYDNGSWVPGNPGVVYSDEQAQDAINDMLNNNGAVHSGINFVYDDVANSMTASIDISPFSIGTLADVDTAGVVNGQVLKYQNGSWTPSQDVGRTDEEIQDLVGAMLLDGNGITWTYDDNNAQIGGSVTIDHLSVGGLSDVTLAAQVNKQVLISNGVNFENRLLDLSDISDSGTLVTLAGAQNIIGDKTFSSAVTFIGTAEYATPAGAVANEIASAAFVINYVDSQSHVEAVGELADVSVNNPLINQVLVYDGVSDFVNRLLASTDLSDSASIVRVTDSINALADVDLGGALVEGKVLKVVNGVFTQADDIDTDIFLTQEAVEDFVGAQFTHANHSTGITFTYDDPSSEIRATLATSLQDYTALVPNDGSIIIGDGQHFTTESGAVARASLGLTIGTHVQAYNARLAEISALNPDLNNFIVGDGAAFSLKTPAQVITALNLANLYQPLEATLTALSGVGTAANKIIYTTGVDQFAETDLTAFGRSLIDDADALTARATLGVTIGTHVQAYSAQLTTFSNLNPADGNFIVGNGVSFVVESGATARASLGLGSAALNDEGDFLASGSGLDDLSNVQINGSANRQFLVNDGTGNYVNRTISSTDLSNTAKIVLLDGSDELVLTNVIKPNGGINVNGGNFTVAANGDVVVGGSLDVSGLTATQAGVSVINTNTGNASLHITPNGDNASINSAGGSIGFNLATLTDINSITSTEASFSLLSTSSITLGDNLAVALEVREGANSYMTFVTTDAGEKIVMSKPVEVATSLNVGNVSINNGVISNGGAGIDFDGESLATTGSVNINGGAFTIDGATGNVSTQGTLSVNTTSTFTGLADFNGGVDLNAGTIVGVSTLTTTTIDATGDTLNLNLKDNKGIALKVAEGANSYIEVDTTDTAEEVRILKPLEIEGTLQLGSGSLEDTTGQIDLGSTSVTTTGNLTVQDLTVNGVQNINNQNNLQVNDSVIELNANFVGNNANDLGLLLTRGDEDDALIIWDEGLSSFVLATHSGAVSVNTTDFSGVAGLTEANLKIGGLTTTASVTVGTTLSVTGTGTITAPAQISNGNEIVTAAWVRGLGLSDLTGTTEAVQDISGGQFTHANHSTGITFTYDDPSSEIRATLDAGLQSISTLGTVADRILYTTGADTYAETAITLAGRNLIASADPVAHLGLVIGTDVQAYNARLAEISNIAVPVADNFLAGDGNDFVLKTPAQARTSLGLDQANARVTLGFGTAVTNDTTDFLASGSGLNDLSDVVITNDLVAGTPLVNQVLVYTNNATFENVQLTTSQLVDGSSLIKDTDSINRLHDVDTTGHAQGKILVFNANGHLVVGDKTLPEEVQDTVGGMITAGNQTDITVTYDDANDKIDFSVDATIARLNSPAFTGTPTAPTANQGDNSTQLATTSYVDTAVQGVIIGGGFQPNNDNLTDISGLTPDADNFIVGDGNNFVQETPAQVRATLGLGTAAQNDTGDFLASGSGLNALSDVTLGATANKQFLVHDGVNGFANRVISTSDLSDGAGVLFNTSSINDLSDVDTTGKADGRVLKFNAQGDLVVGDDLGKTEEEIQDIVGTMFVANNAGNTHITFAYDDTEGANDGTITATVSLNSTDLGDSALLARLASPAFTGTPTAPKADLNDDSNKIATTSYVQQEIHFLAQDYQPLDDRLTEISNIAIPTADNFLAGDGNDLVLKTPAQARTSLGLDQVNARVTLGFGTAVTNDTGDFLASGSGLDDLSDVVLGATANKQFLVHDGNNFANRIISTTDLSDGTDIPLLDAQGDLSLGSDLSVTGVLTTGSLVTDTLTLTGGVNPAFSIEDGASTYLQINTLVGFEKVSVTQDFEATGDVTLSSIEVSGTQITAGGAGITFGAESLTTTGTVTVGNLTVNGTLTTINTDNLSVKDRVVELNSGIGANNNANDLGLFLNRGNDADALILWDEGEDAFVFATHTGAVDGTTADYSDVAHGGSFSRAPVLTGNMGVTGTLSVSGQTTLTGLLLANGGVNVNGGNFIVDSATGNVSTIGTLTVTSTGTITAPAQGANANEIVTAAWVRGLDIFDFNATAEELEDAVAGQFTHGNHGGGLSVTYIDDGGVNDGEIRISTTGNLADIATITHNAGDFIVGDGNNFTAQTPAQVRATLDLEVGTDVQAYDAGLQSISGLVTGAGQIIYTTAPDTYATSSISAFGRSLIDDADAATARATLGLVINTDVQEHHEFLTELSNLDPLGANQVIYSDALGDLATSSISAFGRSLIDDADAGVARATLGVVIGTNVQAQDAGLQSISGLVTAADQMIYTTALDTYATTSLTAFGRSLIDDADALTARATLGVVIGTDVQAQDAGLQSISGLVTGADQMIYTTALDTYATTSLTTFGRSLLDDADATTARATLGVVIGTDVQAQNGLLQEFADLDPVAANRLFYTDANGNLTTSVLTAQAIALLDDSTSAAQRTTLGLVIGTDVQAQDAGLESISGLITAADQMIYTTGADTYATTSLTAFGRSLIDDANALTARATLGVTIGTDVQAYDPALQSISGLVTGANQIIYTTAQDTYATSAVTAFGLSLIDDADALTARSTLGVVIGTDVQAYDPALQSISGLVTGADQMIYTTGVDTYATTTITAVGRALLDDATVADQRATLGLGDAALVNTSVNGGVGEQGKAVVLDGTGKLGALDGSALTALGSINTLSDVDTTGLDANDVLTWDAGQGKFVPTALQAQSIASTAQALIDGNGTNTGADTIDFSYDAQNEVINLALGISTSNLTDVSAAPDTNKQVLRYTTDGGLNKYVPTVLGTSTDYDVGTAPGEIILLSDPTQDNVNAVADLIVLGRVIETIDYGSVADAFVDGQDFATDWNGTGFNDTLIYAAEDYGVLVS